MTQEYFGLLKADLLETYKNDLCEESVEAINKARTPDELVGLLAEFSAFLNYKAIPTADWVEKWFGEYEQLAKDNGVYFKGYSEITNPIKQIVVLGDATISLKYSEPHYYRVTLQDNAKCELTTLCACMVRVRQKGNSIVNILHKHNLSQVKINKI